MAVFSLGEGVCVHATYKTDSMQWREALARYLPTFFSQAPGLWQGLACGVPLTGMTLDSREIEPGMVFLAVPGAQQDGRHFIQAALHRGAACVLYDTQGQEDGLGRESSVVWPVTGLCRLLSAVASCFYGHPSHQLDVVGVTGTNGKTSCVHFLRQLLQAHGIASAALGTLGCMGLEPPAHRAKTPGRQVASSLTTPDAVCVQRLLAHCVQSGKRVVCMEVSSHALDQGRVDAVRFAVGVFTHLSRDHLDYHGDMVQYWAAKRRLFTDLNPAAWVINGQDAYGQALLALWQSTYSDRPCWVYTVCGHSGSAADRAQDQTQAVCPASCTVLRAEKVTQLPRGLTLTVCLTQGQQCGGQAAISERAPRVLQTPLWGGQAQAMNVLAVLCAAGALCQVGRPITRSHLTWQAVCRGASWTQWEPVPGRWQWLRQSGTEDGVVAVVDYAHTPDALAQVLASLRVHCIGRLWCVFGCGGQRDSGKRPQMAQAAAQGADYLVLTQDNPRHEAPDAIMADMLAGLAAQQAAGQIVPPYWVESDRGAAIDYALSYAMAGDVVLIAGKGHEMTQTVGGRVLPFSDLRQVKRYFDAVAVPTLPHADAGFSIDTRTLLPGEIFFALSGTARDGHDFLSDAWEKGACAAVVKNTASLPLTCQPLAGGGSKPASSACAWLRVPDTAQALGWLGAAHRRRFRYPVVGVTGSCGKSTTKTLIGTILGQVGRVCVTPGNDNNQLGVPLTLRRLSEQHDYAVIEMGTSEPGEIRRLAQWVRPTVALITNAQAAHLSGLHTLEGVVQEKGDMLLGPLPGEGTVVLPLESPFFSQWLARAVARQLKVVAFSVCAPSGTMTDAAGRPVPVVYAARVSAVDAVPGSLSERVSFQTFVLHVPDGQHATVHLPLLGEHNKANAVAAAAVGYVLGVPVAVMCTALRQVPPLPGRLCIQKGQRGEMILDDTYNANPAAVMAALDVLVHCAHTQGKRSLCVLGDMQELGTQAAHCHADMGRAACEKGVEVLWVVGRWAKYVVQGFCASQQPAGVKGMVREFNTKSALIAALQAQVGADTVVLVKGSHAAEMAQVVQALCAQETVSCSA